ncbi:ABC transporter substrate-binding protein [Chelativorans sp. SCAU2101]|jgi:ABC-type amino acid transport/signal transduction systems, periplasmic component/domain|uniref:ABC transporter substrate-binding protein n=1 Tax=Chelativorans petroleitrophicus TaxID=2975484 RepID=A0A9X2XAM9_9HYPH|nr:ABC transporter substrate-binding protein [Chelativorans petroleitrophicus]MCT8991843.1 ABC transporter substrate-binding protein [Chelativorans petroleitrophicus]
MQTISWMTAVSKAAFMTALVHAGVASAQGYDTSTVEVSEALAARVPSAMRAAGVLVGGSDNDYAPWEYLAGEDGQTPEGIDIDIGNAIAAKLGLKYESRTAQFTTILPSLGTNYDIGLSAFSITEERKQVVNFVSYAATGNEWIVKAGNPTGFDPSDICGRQIAVQSGSRHEERLHLINQECISRGKPEMTFLPFKTQTEAVTRVATGGADATVTGSATALYAAFVSNGALETMRPVGELLDVRGLNGIAIAKDDMELTQLIADTLNELIGEGTYKAILDAWGMGAVAVEEALINPVEEH